MAAGGCQSSLATALAVARDLLGPGRGRRRRRGGGRAAPPPPPPPFGGGAPRLGPPWAGGPAVPAGGGGVGVVVGERARGAAGGETWGGGRVKGRGGGCRGGNPPVANSTMALKNRNNSFQGSMGDLLRDLTVRRPSGVGHGAAASATAAPGRQRTSAPRYPALPP